ncbi:growth-blocking peptide, long form-like [Nymphalis io]|uniref:growth-blocking peptide, long form-like n=1 Tax=Inachis io TaxID=171585 RepID=UPI0021674A71|nr:growth-blocking peptide, long form-like [Nymphalis io]
MRSVYCLCIIVNLLLLNSEADAGLVKGIISSIHDTAHKVRDDIHQALHFKEDPKKETADVVTVADNKTNGDNKFVATSTAAYNNKEVNKEVTGVVMPKDEDDSKLIFVTNPTTESTVNFTSTTVKDGRENFAGGCSTGYERTVDGRCRPTF